jgi:hypothetical protein
MRWIFAYENDIINEKNTVLINSTKSSLVGIKIAAIMIEIEQ